MSPKKKINQDSIISNYMNYVLDHGEKPKTVYKFAKHNNFEEQEFYKHFGSFDALEKTIFEHFFVHTIQNLEASDAYDEFDARQKLLAFYYTFFELITANRSYVSQALSKSPISKMKTLSKLKNKFTHFIHELPIEMLDLKNERLETIQTKGMQESAWMQLLVTMKFWLDDDSPGFEKTDLFIEKSVNASFDLMDVKPLKSVLDLGKFLVKEKLNMA